MHRCKRRILCMLLTVAAAIVGFALMMGIASTVMRPLEALACSAAASASVAVICFTTTYCLLKLDDDEQE